MRKTLKKRIHPVLGYAFLASAGILSFNGTAALLERPGDAIAPEPPAAAIRIHKAVPPDFPTLQAAAGRFAAEIATVKSQALAAEKEGRHPPAELYDAIGQGEQLMTMITQAPDQESLGDIDAIGQMNDIAERIKENSRF